LHEATSTFLCWWWCIPVLCGRTSSLHGNLSSSNSSFLIECLSDIVVIQKSVSSSSLGFNRILSSNNFCCFLDMIVKNFSRFSWVPWSWWSIFLSKTCSSFWCEPVTSSILGWWSTSLHVYLSSSDSSFLIESFSNIVVIQKFGGSSSLSFNRILGCNDLSSMSNRFFKQSS